MSTTTESISCPRCASDHIYPTLGRDRVVCTKCGLYMTLDKFRENAIVRPARCAGYGQGQNGECSGEADVIVRDGIMSRYMCSAHAEKAKPAVDLYARMQAQSRASKRTAPCTSCGHPLRDHADLTGRPMFCVVPQCQCEGLDGHAVPIIG